MTIKLIAVDMDETFLKTDKTYDVTRFKKILKILDEQEIIFLVASGNSYHQLKEKFDDDVKPKLYFAGDNGSFIVKNNDILETCGINRELYLEIIDYIKRFVGDGIYVSTGKESYILKNSSIYNIAKVYNGVLHEVDKFEDIPDNEFAYKIAIINPLVKSLAVNKILADKISKEFPQVFSVTSGNIFIDIIHKNSGKGHAVEYLQNKYNISEGETMIFGDSMNDLSMVPKAKYSIAMANSDPDFMKHCKFKTGTNDEQSVLNVIEAYLDNSLETILKKN